MPLPKKPDASYAVVRLRRETYDALQALRERIALIGVKKLPPALQMTVGSLSDVVDVAVRAARKVIG